MFSKECLIRTIATSMVLLIPGPASAAMAAPSCESLFLSSEFSRSRLFSLMPTSRTRIETLLDSSKTPLTSRTEESIDRNVDKIIQVFGEKDSLNLFGADIRRYPIFVGSSLDGRILFFKTDGYGTILSIDPVRMSPERVAVGIENSSKTILETVQLQSREFDLIIENASQQLGLHYTRDRATRDLKGAIRFKNAFHQSPDEPHYNPTREPLLRDLLLDQAYIVRSAKLLGADFKPATSRQTAIVVEALLEGRKDF